MTADWVWGFFWGDENILKLDMAMVAYVSEYIKTQILFFKRMNFKVCELSQCCYLKKKKRLSDLPKIIEQVIVEVGSS